MFRGIRRRVGRRRQVPRAQQPFLEEDTQPEERETGEGSDGESVGSDSTVPATSEGNGKKKSQMATFSALLGALPNFPDELDMNKAREHWRQFIRRFEEICRFRSDMGQLDKKILLGVKGGMMIQNIIRQLEHKWVDESPTIFDEVRDAINKYFETHSVRQIDIEKFRSIRQENAETFTKFMHRLRAQADLCGFKTVEIPDSEVAQMIVIGARDRTYITQKLGDKPEMSLEELELAGTRYELARAFETRKTTGTSFDTAHLEPINKVKVERGDGDRGRDRNKERHRSPDERYRSHGPWERERGRRDQSYRDRSRSQERRGRSSTAYYGNSGRSSRRDEGYRGYKRDEPCFKCGGRCAGMACKAREHRCDNCDKKGHFEKYCFRAPRQGAGDIKKVSEEV